MSEAIEELTEFVARGIQAQEAVNELLGAEDAIFCAVCKNLIPEARARRQTATCSEKCKNKLDAIRERRRAATKCPACRHPSTPEERESFRRWRAERGDLRSPDKRDPSLPAKRTMAQTLRKALRALYDEKDRLEAQLEAQNAPQGDSEAGTGIVEEGQIPRKDPEPWIAARVALLTTLTSEAESLLTPQAQPE